MTDMHGQLCACRYVSCLRKLFNWWHRSLEDPKAIKAHTIHSLCVQHVCGIRQLLMRQTQGKCILDGLVKPSVPPPIVARHQTDKKTI